MRTKWTQEQHTIADVLEWSKAYRLELNPDYQRKDVWSAHARIMLIDSIIRDLPIPKIFASLTKNGAAPHCQVIDGQQRISAILGFLNDKFSLDHPYEGKEKGKRFSELGKKLQNKILSYSLDFDIVSDLNDLEIRDIYSRLNKYTAQLNKQELRLADYPGDFLDTARELADCDYFESIEIFSTLDRRRYLDVEYVSELLAAMLNGLQDEDKYLDRFYQDYAEWREKEKVKLQFKKVLSEFEALFDKHPCHISMTRYKEKTDFYTLFLLINDFIKAGKTIKDKDTSELLSDLSILDENISLDSPVKLYKDYAIKCIHLADSLSSRRWRAGFMKLILSGTFANQPPAGMMTNDNENISVINTFYQLAEDIYLNYPLWPAKNLNCAVCNEALETDTRNLDEYTITWPAGTENFQISNIQWVHSDCTNEATDWVILGRHDVRQEALL